MTNRDAQFFLIRALETAASARRRLLTLGAVIMASGVLIAVGLAAGILDYAFHLPVWSRAMLLIMTMAATVWTWRRRKKSGAATPDKMAARLEVAFDHLHDRLVTAAEIATSSIRAPATISSRMIDAGAELIEEIPYRRAVAPEMTWSRLGRRLIPFALLTIAAVMSSEGVLRHAGRLFLPGARIAPLTKTRLDISPGDTRVVKGEDIEIVLKTTGEIPAEARIRFDRPGLEREEKMMTQISRGTFGAKVARPAEDFEYWIAAGDAVSFAYSVRVAAPPELVDPVVRIEPPAYTKLPPRDQPPGPVTAPAGATIGVESQVRPDAVASVLVVKTGEERQTLSLGRGGSKIAGSFNARESGEWAVQLTGEDGLSARAPGWPIVVVPDRKPAVRIRHPAGDAMATPEETVPIVFSSSDDYGLARVQLRIAWDSGPERIPQQRVYDGSVRETDGVFAISIGQLGLEPGDMLRYRIEALDANDVTGPGVSSTDLRFIEIVSEDVKEKQAAEGAGADQTTARIRELIEMEKQVMRRTLRDVAAAPSPDAAEPVRRMQKSTREETDTTASEIESLADEDELSGAEALKESLTDASGSMRNAETSLQKCDGQNALSHEGAALTALNKALCSSCSNPSATDGGQSGRGGGPRMRRAYSPSGPVMRRPGMSREGRERNRGGRRPTGSEERRSAQRAEELAKALGRAAESMRQGAKGRGGVTPEMRDQLQQLLAQSEQMAGTRVPRAGRPAISATGDLIRQAVEISRRTYAPSGPIAKLLDDAARLMTETRETLLDAARRKEILMEDRRRENVPDEYRDLVRDYYRRLGS